MSEEREDDDSETLQQYSFASRASGVGRAACLWSGREAAGSTGAARVDARLRYERLCLSSHRRMSSTAASCITALATVANIMARVVAVAANRAKAHKYDACRTTRAP